MSQKRTGQIRDGTYVGASLRDAFDVDPQRLEMEHAEPILCVCLLCLPLCLDPSHRAGLCSFALPLAIPPLDPLSLVDARSVQTVSRVARRRPWRGVVSVVSPVSAQIGYKLVEALLGVVDTRGELLTTLVGCGRRGCSGSGRRRGDRVERRIAGGRRGRHRRRVDRLHVFGRLLDVDALQLGEHDSLSVGVQGRSTKSVERPYSFQRRTD